MTYSKVQDHIGLLRDESTNAIVNTNMIEYNNYINVMRTKKQEKEKINNIQEQVNELKNDISEIKNLLLKMINN